MMETKSFKKFLEIVCCGNWYEEGEIAFSDNTGEVNILTADPSHVSMCVATADVKYKGEDKTIYWDFESLMRCLKTIETYGIQEVKVKFKDGEIEFLSDDISIKTRTMVAKSDGSARRMFMWDKNHIKRQKDGSMLAKRITVITPSELMKLVNAMRSMKMENDAKPTLIFEAGKGIKCKMDNEISDVSFTLQCSCSFNAKVTVKGFILSKLVSALAELNEPIAVYTSEKGDQILVLSTDDGKYQFYLAGINNEDE